MADAPYDLCACPSCGTEFRVTAADLAKADGHVRCGACMTVFDGSAQREAPAALAEADMPAAGLAASTDAPKPPVATSAQGPTSPKRERPARSRARRPRIGWRLAGVLAFGAALGANAMALRHYGGQPDLAAFEVAAPLAVERTDSPPGVVVTGGLVNRAGAPQRLPSLLVRLQHEDATIAEARFRPGEYLAGRTTRTPLGTLLGETLAANESTFVALQVEEAEGVATTATVTLAWPP